jgi:DNA-binding NarL/FixJ family response regulator
MKNVIIFDKSFFFSKSVGLILKEKFNIASVRFASSLNEIQESISIATFDLIIIDINDNESLGFDLIKKLKNNSQQTKVLILSFIDNPLFINNCYKSGASYFLNKNCTEEKLKQILNLLLFSNEYFLNDVDLVKFNSTLYKPVSKKYFHIDKLSKREYQIAQMFVKGITNIEISKILNLSMSTISTYKKRILLKTETENLIEFSSIYQNNLVVSKSYADF